MKFGFHVKPKTLDSANLFIISLATLLYEVNLTRIFSITQYYHFAFLIIGFAMFGFGASGTCFALTPKLTTRYPRSWMAGFSLGFTATCAAGHFLMTAMPFDSYSIAWDWRQAINLAAQCLVLSLPFFCSGAVLNICFSQYSNSIGQLYATNLVGSACGCILVMVLPHWIGSDGVTWMSGLLGAFAAIMCVLGIELHRLNAKILLAIAGCSFSIFLVILICRPPFIELRLSPYKGLSYALQYPDSVTLSQRWNGYSRIDVVASNALRTLPGLSYLYQGPLPEQHALFIDGDGLSGILVEQEPDDEISQFTAYLPSAIAYQLKSTGQVLILEPRGGLETWTALTQGNHAITVVEANPLISSNTAEVTAKSNVTLIEQDARSTVRSCTNQYDIVSLPLTTPYHPIRSGAYSLVEDYHQTVQAYGDYLECATHDGVLVITTWLQTPPSESLRVFTTAVSALESLELAAPERIVAFRGYNTMTFLISRSAWMPESLQTIRVFIEQRAYDLVFAPDISKDEVNVHNILPDAYYYEIFRDYIASKNRLGWIRQYAYDVRPATDMHPFFGHFFKLSQTGQILAELGKTWQPFGGAGYFVIILLLVLSMCGAGILILIPYLSLKVTSWDTPTPKCNGLLVYGLIGLAFMLVEIPLTQRFILYLGHPAYAMTAVLFTLLTASGLGSLMAAKLHLRTSLLWIVVCGTVLGISIELIIPSILHLNLFLRLLITVIALLPLGVMMGMPFSLGMRRYKLTTPRCISYAWSVNGAASVVASILAAFLALSTDLRIVYFVGIVCYACAALVVLKAPVPPHHR